MTTTPASAVSLYFAKRLVADLTAEQMCQQPHGVVNHPAWSLGHLAFSSVGLLKALGHDASLPVGWGEAFVGAFSTGVAVGWKARSASVRTNRLRETSGEHHPYLV